MEQNITQLIQKIEDHYSQSRTKIQECDHQITSVEKLFIKYEELSHKIGDYFSEIKKLL